MPSRERVEAFVAMVEQGRYVEAIQEFYAEDATMQENGEPPRGGREALAEGDRIAEERFFYDRSSGGGRPSLTRARASVDNVTIRLTHGRE